ncbi:MAG: MarR family winged helix-turn-helix transcriptional regulator [Gammaproteobacteria bacterium]
MDENYINGLTKEQRAAWGVQILIRLWLSGMCRSQAAQNWTIAQIAILFEVTQAHLFREESHTATSLSKELNLPIQTVSRSVRDLRRMGLISQREASDDARKKYLVPADYGFARDAMEDIIRNFGSQWYHGWDELDKANGACWYFPMSECSDNAAQEEIQQFKRLATGD